MNETELNREIMTKVLSSGESHDWLQYLSKDEIVESDHGKIPRLHGLQRLANIRGIKDMSVDHLTVSIINSKKFGAEVPIVAVSVRIEFEDGQVVANAADCHPGNCSDLGNFPTAVATSRAIGRALSDAFNIRHVEEELDSMTADDAFGDPETKASDVQIKALKQTAKMRKLILEEQIQARFPEKEEANPDDLTNGEATQLMIYMNNRKK